MKYAELLEIKKTIFTSADVAEALGIKPQSASVLCNRYVKSGLLIRLKRDLYTFAERWASLGTQDFFLISNRLQVPSYISLTTALSYYGLTTQVQQAYFESISFKQNLYSVKGVSFRYFKIKPNLYFGFLRKDGLFLAAPEKALLDALYLQSFGRYNLDMAALELDKIDKSIVYDLGVHFPEKAKKLVEKLWRG